MSDSYYIYSTLSTGVTYVDYTHSPGGALNIAQRRVSIKGGANVANRKTLVTPRGMVTKISAEDYAWLQHDHTFKKHVQNGFIEVSKASVDPEVAASDMELRDDSSPIVPQDYMAEGFQGAKPVGLDKELEPNNKASSDKNKHGLIERLKRMG